MDFDAFVKDIRDNSWNVFACLITQNKPEIPATTFIVLLLIAPIFKKADIALYRSKADKVNRYCFYE